MARSKDSAKLRFREKKLALDWVEPRLRKKLIPSSSLRSSRAKGSSASVPPSVGIPTNKIRRVVKALGSMKERWNDRVRLEKTLNVISFGRMAFSLNFFTKGLRS